MLLQLSKHAVLLFIQVDMRADRSIAARMSLEEAFFLAYGLQCLTVHQSKERLSEQVSVLGRHIKVKSMPHEFQVCLYRHADLGLSL